MPPIDWNAVTSQDANTEPPLPVLGEFRPEPPSATWWAKLFAIPGGNASSKDVRRWWAARRLLYNAMVFGLGIPSFCLFLFFITNSGQLAGGEDAFEPLGMIFMPILVNICYTFGCIGELLWRKVSGVKTREAGQNLMRVGVGFSLFVIFFPTVIWGVTWFVVTLRRALHTY